MLVANYSHLLVTLGIYTAKGEEKNYNNHNNFKLLLSFSGIAKQGRWGQTDSMGGITQLSARLK